MISDHIISRHYELWKQHSDGIRRWVSGALLFSFIVLFRVIEPYTAATDNLRLTEQKLEIQRQRESLAENELSEADRIISSVNKIYEIIIDKPPWRDTIKKLKLDLPRLGEAYRLLVNMDPKVVNSLLFSSRNNEVLQKRNQAAVKNQTRRAQNQWQQIGSAPTDRQREGDPLRAKPLEPEDAIILLELRKDRLVNIENKAYKEYLEVQVQHKAQIRADDAIANILELIELKILDPIKLIVDNTSRYSIRNSILKIVKKLKDGMDSWRDKLLNNPTWYKTVASKESAVADLEHKLTDYQNDFIKISAKERQGINTEINLQKGRLLKINKEVSELVEETKRISDTLEKTLPEWVGGLVNPVLMTQLFPFIILVLVLILAVKTYCARMHFISVRSHFYPERQDRQDASLSSIWTLVYRGASGTAFTVIVFLCGILLLWFCFERGYKATLLWLPNHPENALETVSLWLNILKPIARIVLVLCICGIPIPLVRDFMR